MDLSVEEDLIQDVYSYITETKYPQSCSVNRKRTIRRKAKQFEVSDGVLYYKKKIHKKEVLLRYIVRVDERNKILHGCHVDKTAGHMGREKTINRIKERFMWHGMVKDVNNLLSKCDVCQRMNRKLTTGTPKLNPIPVVSPWYQIGIDYIGPISPPASDGSKYILTVCDYFTKWVEAVATSDKLASTVAMHLYKLFMRMGLPCVIVSDNGTEFNNQLEKALHKSLGIKRRLTTPYHPQISPITKQLQNDHIIQPQPVKACVTEPVKVIAFKKRQKKIEEATKGSVIKINLDTVKSPKKRRRANVLSKIWVKHPLTMEDKGVLLKGEWLNDHLIDAGQELIKQKYQQKYGFQSVVLGRTLAFDVLQGKEFVQVLYTGANHWVTVSTLGCKGNEVDIYDSMRPSLTHKLQEQIAVLLHTSNQSIVVRYRQCQIQVGSLDCGVFALAFASVLACGGHPSSHQFEQQLMRGHLEKCITSDNFTPFPVRKLGRQNNKVRLIKEITIYCDCRMPAIFSKEMIQCTSCHDWYHLVTCIPRIASNIDKWICNSCNIVKQ